MSARPRYAQAMVWTYTACIVLSGAAPVVITLIIPCGVFMRYAMNQPLSWPEPAAVVMMVLFSFVGGAAVYRDYRWRDLPHLVHRVVTTVAMVMMLIGFSVAFGYMMAIMQVPAKVTQVFLGISENKCVFLLLVNIVLLLGTFMDVAPMLLICTPIFLPVITLLAISTTVQCVAGVLDAALARIRRELLPKYPNVDGVVGPEHSYGCGVAIEAPGAEIPIRTLRRLARNPSFGGEVMLLSLGCEKLQPELLLPPGSIELRGGST